MKTRFTEPYSDPRWWWNGDVTPIYFECDHFWGMINGKPRCKAFPDGIKREALRNSTQRNDKSDCCIHFEQYELF